MNIGSCPLLAPPCLGSLPVDLLARAAIIPAAAYCDEPSVNAFIAKVQRGTESRAR
jgi:hypothetical protein